MRSTAPVPVRSAGPRRSLVAGRPLAASPTGNGFAQATRNLSIAAACPYRTLGLRPGDEVSDVDIKAVSGARPLPDRRWVVCRRIPCLVQCSLSIISMCSSACRTS
jgi:hypothetical protein